jgi:predicted transcriptional regulator
MKTVILDVRTLSDTLSDAATAMETLTPTEPRISFDTPELLWKVLTAKRWNILKALTGAGPVSIREVARRVGRDVKAVHGDIHALLLAGVIDKTDDGKVIFPYDALHVDFMIKAA